MRELYERKEKGYHLLFLGNYAKEHLHGFINEDELLPWLSDEIIKNIDFFGLRRVEIYFKMCHPFKRGFTQRAVAIAQDRSDACMSDVDVAHGRNRVYINIDTIITHNFFTVAGQQEIRSMPKDALRKIRGGVYADVLEACTHELAHIKQVRINSSNEAFKRNSARVKAAVESMARSADRVMTHEDLSFFWHDMREMLLMFLDGIVYEGFAVFVTDYAHNRISFDEGSVRNTYAEAYRLCYDVNSDLGKMYRGFLCAIKEKDEAQVAHDIHVQLGDIIRCLPDHAYEIGRHVYHLILFSDEDLLVEDVAAFDYRKVLKVYEKQCRKLGWQPVVGLDSEGAIFSYRNHVIMLNRLRKETAGIRR